MINYSTHKVNFIKTKDNSTLLTFSKKPDVGQAYLEPLSDSTISSYASLADAVLKEEVTGKEGEPEPENNEEIEIHASDATTKALNDVYAPIMPEGKIISDVMLRFRDQDGGKDKSVKSFILSDKS